MLRAPMARGPVQSAWNYEALISPWMGRGLMEGYHDELFSLDGLPPWWYIGLNFSQHRIFIANEEIFLGGSRMPPKELLMKAADITSVIIIFTCHYEPEGRGNLVSLGIASSLRFSQ